MIVLQISQQVALAGTNVHPLLDNLVIYQHVRSCTFQRREYEIKLISRRVRTFCSFVYLFVCIAYIKCVIVVVTEVVSFAVGRMRKMMPRETTDEKLGLTGNRSKTRLQSLSSWFAFSHCLPGTLHEIHDRPTDRQTFLVTIDQFRYI